MYDLHRDSQVSQDDAQREEDIEMVDTATVKKEENKEPTKDKEGSAEGGSDSSSSESS
jgi:hypothetical protein